MVKKAKLERARHIGHELWYFIKRYVPSEIAGTITTLASGWIVFTATVSPRWAAVASLFGEDIGYYGVMIPREIRRALREHAENPQPQQTKRTVVWLAIYELFREFLPAELIYIPIWTPAMLLGTWLIDDLVWRTLLVKFMADAVFYTVAAYIHKKNKRRAQQLQSV